MTRKGRYANTPAFEANPRGNIEFRGLRPREVSNAPGVLEHSVTTGERLDRLSQHYFDDNRIWWRIADANPQFLYAPDMLFSPGSEQSESDDPLRRRDMIGRTILIPKARE